MEHKVIKVRLNDQDFKQDSTTLEGLLNSGFVIINATSPHPVDSNYSSATGIVYVLKKG